MRTAPARSGSMRFPKSSSAPTTWDRATTNRGWPRGAAQSGSGTANGLWSTSTHPERERRLEEPCERRRDGGRPGPGSSRPVVLPASSLPRTARRHASIRTSADGQPEARAVDGEPQHGAENIAAIITTYSPGEGITSGRARAQRTRAPSDRRAARRPKLRWPSVEARKLEHGGADNRRRGR